MREPALRLGPSQTTAVTDSESLDQIRTAKQFCRRVRPRIAVLPASTRQLLLELALDKSGGALDVEEAVRRGNAIGILVPAVDSELIDNDDGSRAPGLAHPLIASILVEMSTARERWLAHRSLANSRRQNPQERLRNLAASTLAPDQGVADQLTLAARQSRKEGDVANSIETLLTASRLSADPFEREERLYEAAYVAIAAEGDLSRATRLCEEARSQRGGSELSLHSAAVSAYRIMMTGGHLETACNVLVRAIRAFSSDGRPNDQSLTEATRTLLRICTLAGRADLWQAANEIVSFVGPNAPDDLSLNERADLWSVGNIASAALVLDQLSAYRVALSQIAAGKPSGQGSLFRAAAFGQLGLQHFMSGKWGDAELAVEEGLGICEAYGLSECPWQFDYVRSLIAAARGDISLSQELASAMSQFATPRGFGNVERAAHHVRCLAAAGQGDYEGAYKHAVAISPVGEFPFHIPMARFVATDLVESAIRTGRTAEASAHVDAMREGQRGVPSPLLALSVGSCSAMTTSDPQDSIAAFEAALATPGIQDWPFELARVQLRYGEWMRRYRKVNESSRLLDAAFDTFRALGAVPWALRAQAELRATGKTKQKSAATGSQSMTHQESEIANLAASGLTNKEIATRMMISSRTVSAHLYRVFPKLGVTSRAALRDALNEAGM